jgi:regulator of ribosome biosynthesis
VLPFKEEFTLPRTRKLPGPKPETRWEKFARERGIQKQKKERMVFDEDSGEYRPRFGYKRAKGGVEDLPIVEVKQGADHFADPWSDARADKKERVQKNAKNQKRNQVFAQKSAKGKKGYDPESVPGIPVEFSRSNSKRGKAGVRKALQLVQHSTASMGRFDEMRPGEPVRKISGKKRAYRDNISSLGSEKAVMKSQLRIVEDKVSKKARGVTNSLAAYEGILPDAPSLAFKQSKGRGKNAGKIRSKPAGKKL